MIAITGPMKPFFRNNTGGSTWLPSASLANRTPAPISFRRGEDAGAHFFRIRTAVVMPGELTTAVRSKGRWFGVVDVRPVVESGDDSIEQVGTTRN